MNGVATMLDAMIAREAIRDLLARYTMAGDARDLEGFVAVFAEDAWFRSAFFDLAGKCAIREWFSERVARSARKALLARHHLATCRIQLISETTAEARTYFSVFSDIGADHHGVYQDTLVRREQGWLIAGREVLVDWVHPESRLLPSRSQVP